MAVRKKGDRWVVEFMQRGVRVFRRLPAGRGKQDAQQLESKLRGEIFNAVDLGKLPDPLLEKVINEWLETKRGTKAESQTRSHAANVICAIAARSLKDIAQAAEDVRGQAVHGRGGTLSNATVNRRLCILKAVAKYAYQKGYAQENLSGKIQLLPENNARHVYLSQVEVAAIIDAAHTDEVKAFIAWAAFTGMRQGEIMALRPEDVDSGSVRIRDSKVGRPRVIPVIPQLAPYLEAIPFRSHKRTLYAGFEAARDKAGIAHCTYHDLRHSVASLLINSGAELYTVGELLGHKSIQTTKRYAHLSIETQRSAMERAFGDGQGKTGGVQKTPRGKGKTEGALRRVAGKARVEGKVGGAGQRLAGRKPRKETGP